MYILVITKHNFKKRVQRPQTSENTNKKHLVQHVTYSTEEPTDMIIINKTQGADAAVVDVKMVSMAW